MLVIGFTRFISLSCGLRLDDEAIRVAVGLRLGLNICQPHPCSCGTQVDARGTHGLSCKLRSGRMARHHHLNDLIERALSRAGIFSSKEPSSLAKTDGKRSNGINLIPWQASETCLGMLVVDSCVTSPLNLSSNGRCGGECRREKGCQIQ